MNVAMIGFGTVGQGFLEILNNKSKFLKKKYNFNPEIVAISDPKYGSVYNEKGLKIGKILNLLKDKGDIRDYPNSKKGWDSMKIIRESNADTIVEVTPTNIETGKPGIDFIKTALGMGKNVVTTNKGPIALAYKKLVNMASKNNCKLKFEGTVLAGTPSLNLVFSPLAGNEISSVKGIVNGTTNYILTRMESGMSYVEALKEAQDKGYAEAVPDADVKGWDAVAKIVIISNVLMEGNIKVEDVKRKGIEKIKLDDIKTALKDKKHWKLIAEAKKGKGKIKASVKPQLLDEDDPLAGIRGATNAITFKTDILGDITIIGPGAGRMETGFALLTDLIDINRK